MKRKTNILLLMLLSASSIILSCSRYDEGPFVSLRSPENRVEGLWEIKNISIDDIDYSSVYLADTMTKKFSVTRRDEDIFISIVEQDRSNPQWSYSLLTFSQDHKSVVFGFPVIAAYEIFTEDFFELVPAVNVENEWDILRLTNKDWWIRCNYQGVVYRIQFGLYENYRTN